MSLTKASYSMVTGAPVNVLDYGAVADWNGSSGTDNTAAFNAAFTAAATSSRYVAIPKGKYRVNGQLNIPAEMIIQGYDALGGTEIHYTGSGILFKSYGTSPANANYIQLSDMALFNSGTGTIAVDFSYTNYSKLKNLYIASFDKCVFTAFGWDNLFEQVAVWGNGSTSGQYGFYSETESNSVTLINCSAVLFSAGIFLAGVRSYNIIGCNIETCNYGIQISSSTDPTNTSSVLIEGSYLEGNKTQDILIQKHDAASPVARSVIIRDNYFVFLPGGATTSIQIVDVNGLTIQGNLFDDVGGQYTNSVVESGAGTSEQIYYGFNRDYSANGPTLLGNAQAAGKSSAYAWGTFTGTGTIAYTEIFRMATVSRSSAGTYSVTFNSPVPSANYVVVANAEDNGTTPAMIASAYNKSIYGFSIKTVIPGTGLADAANVSFVAFVPTYDVIP